MSNTLPSFKIFAGLEGPSYSSSFFFLLLVLFTVVVSLKTKQNKKHLSQRNPLKIYSHLLEPRISKFHAYKRIFKILPYLQQFILPFG